MDIKLHPCQSVPMRDLFVNKSVRFSVIVASRGFGKSFLACAAGLQAVSELCALPREVPNKNVDIIAPTFTQVREIYMPLMLDVFKVTDKCVKWTQDGVFTFDNGVVLKLRSYEAIEKFRGKGSFFVVGDEPSSWKHGLGLSETLTQIVLPTIATRWSQQHVDKINKKYNTDISPGRAMLIGTPDGYNAFYDVFNFQDVDTDWKSYQYTYRDAPHLDPNEIAKAKAKMTNRQFCTEYEATFEGSSNTVYDSFSRKDHLCDTLDPFMEGEVVKVGIDFNVGIMASEFYAIRGSQMQFLDEMTGDPNSHELGRRIKEKYIDKGFTVEAYPDPSGRSSKSSAVMGENDFTILESYGIKCYAHKAAKKIVDTALAVNTKLKNANGDIGILIDPKACPNLINSFDRTVWKDGNPDSAQIDKSGGHDHWSDAAKYAIEYEFPIEGDFDFMIGTT